LTCIKSNLAKVAKYHLLDLGQIKLSFVVFGDLRMKKSLIALAALSAFATAAQAQSSVSVYGILDVGYSDKEATTAGGTSGSFWTATATSGSKHAQAAGKVTSTNGITGVGSESTSRLGFKGTEDLGGGLKANFVVETGLNPAESTVSAWNTRQAYAGLQGGFGSLNVGTVYTPQHIIAASFASTTLPNVAGDVMYTAATGSALGVTLDKVGIKTTGTTIATATVAGANAALVTAKLAGAANATGYAVADNGTSSSGEIAQAVAIAQTLIDQKAQSTLDARLARANNSSYTVRVNNTVAYQSPVMNGFTGGIAYVLPTQTKVEGGDESTSSATALNLQYAAGKFAAAVAYTAGETKSITNVAAVTAGVGQTTLTTITAGLAGTAVPTAVTTTVANVASDASVTTVEVKTKESMAALSYDLGAAKVSYIYAKRDAKDTVSDLSEKTTHNFGVKAPFGKTTAFVNYSMGDQKVLDGTANAAKFDLDGIQVGASYALSKRSDIYAIYGSAKMDNKANSNDIKDKQYVVGLRHSF
jgi:predicted porin